MYTCGLWLEQCHSFLDGTYRSEITNDLLTNTFVLFSVYCTTSKKILPRCVTDRLTVLCMVIHSISDTSHNEVLGTCALTRLLWYTPNYMRLIQYIMLHSTNLKPNCQMHFFARSQMRSEVHTWLHSTVHSQPAWLTLPACLTYAHK